MVGKPRWEPTGWVASSDGGRVIEFTLTLPAGMFLRVKRREAILGGYRWIIQPGGRDEADPNMSFANASTAKREALNYARAELRRALRMIGER